MLITNGILIIWKPENRIIDNGALLIEKDCIKEIGTTEDLQRKYPTNVFIPSAIIGQLIPGAFADIIFGVQQSMVTTTIVAGKVLMKDRELLTLDDKAISAKARKIAPKARERYNKEVARVL